MNGTTQLAAFVGTLVLTTLEAGAQQVHLSRMSIPYLIGSAFTPRRDRAKVIGFFLHLVNGQIFGLLYIALLHALRNVGLQAPGAGVGALIGVAHGLVVLLVVVPILPGLHPRMASVHQGPTELRQLEPPGPLALYYGFSTPLTVLIAHAIFGAIVGALYQ